MPELIRTEHRLPTVRILLDRVTAADGRPEEQAVLQAMVGAEPPREIARCASEELGLPEGPEPPTEAAFRLPAGVAAGVAAAVAEMDRAGAGTGALWLELPAPHGDLHLVPWERLLAPVVTDRPVLRLPYHMLRPRASFDVVQVAIAGPLSSGALPSDVDAAALLAAHARSWVVNSHGAARVNVFVRDEAAAEVRDLTADVPEIVVHDPGYARDLPASGLGSAISPADLSTNPWLLWMTAALGGRAVDVAHVLTYGNLAPTGGRMMLSRSPIAGGDRDACLLVGSTPLAGALAQLGAWALVLSGLPGDPSPVGLRGLADAIAHLHPGAVIAQAVTGTDTVDFDAAVARVFGGGPAVPALPTLCCWAHPQLVHFSSEQAEALLLTPTGQSAVIAPATSTVLAAQDTPAWVAAGTRFLETQQADWIGSTPSADVDEAAKTALRSVSELLDAHVRKHLSDPGDGEVTT